jgi:hypothetical protein
MLRFFTTTTQFICINIVGMERMIFFGFYELANFTLYLTMLFGLKLFFQRNMPKDYNVILLYQIGTSLLLIYSDFVYFNLFFSKRTLNTVQLFFPIFHFFLLGTFVKKSFKKLFYKQPGDFIFYLFLTLLIFLFFIDQKKLQYYSAAISNFGLLVLCFFYYFSYIVSKVEFLNSKSYSFATVTGIFLSAGISIPIYLFSNIFNRADYPELFYSISIIAPVTSIILYFSFFKSQLCLTQKNI